MKLFINISFALLVFFSSYSIAKAQWQFCGNYTGIVVQMEVKDSFLIAGTYGDGVYITSDGVNWSYHNNGMANGQIISFAVIANSVFAGSEAEGVLRSTDNGINWTPVNNGITNLTIHCLSANGSNLYAATSIGVNKTTDNGENWVRISPTSVGTIIFSVLAYSNKIIATSINGIFITTDEGTSWNNITYGTSNSIYCLTKSNDGVYAGSSASGVFKTTNDGINWFIAGTGLPYGKAVRKIMITDEKVFAALYNSGGIYYLPFSSGSWIQANQGLTQLSCFTVIKFKNNMFAGTVNGIFKRLAEEFTAVNKIGNYIPKEYKLFQNYPNPFNPTTKIRFSIPSNVKRETASVKLIIYDVLGKETANLTHLLRLNCLGGGGKEGLSPGTYEIEWDASGYPSGVYFYRLNSGNFIETKKMLLIK